MAFILAMMGSVFVGTDGIFLVITFPSLCFSGHTRAMKIEHRFMVYPAHSVRSIHIIDKLPYSTSDKAICGFYTPSK